MSIFKNRLFPGLLLGLLAALGLASCQAPSEEQTMNPNQESTRAILTTPEIDRTQPDDFATATFSMG